MRDFRSRKLRAPIDPFLHAPAIEECVIELPRVARIRDDVLRPDQHFDAIVKAWRIQHIHISDQLDCWAAFRFPRGWRIAAPVGDSPSRTLVDPAGNVRAHIASVHREPVLVCVARYYTSIEHDETEHVRIVAIDRVGKRYMRVSPWCHPQRSSEITQTVADYEAWLDELRPGYRDPFRYWE